MSTFAEIAQEVSKLMNDSQDCDDQYNFTRWSKKDLIHYAQDAVVMISMLHPKKFTTHKKFKLAPGRVQQLPSDCTVLTKVIGVTDAAGVASSTALTVNGRLGSVFPSRCTETTSSSTYTLNDYSIESSSENIFYVNPAVPNDGGDVYVDVICSATPEITDSYEPAQWMHNAIIEWALYRAYSSEDESTGADSMAKLHLEHFYTILSNYQQAENAMMRNRGVANATAETN